MPIRIGVIGTGIMGTDHVATITTAVPGEEVCCIADIDARRAEAIASRVPGAKALSSAESAGYALGSGIPGKAECLKELQYNILQALRLDDRYPTLRRGPFCHLPRRDSKKPH
jgi:hypothetical protein